ncbi:CitMHS family transporter [Pseudoduganella buxea]|uniref:Citrate:proton symporter n=1 Tax=Pseudoduganella buxea TaxID=1949069 RepID=A0A6I3T2Z8_9BURK|nr:CitMHS family transporter [Pseudoduganella buxea]MTV55881.1 citrate:proton symporter [Pseudoduganella buxea]GGC22160.1 citrate:proton symporter [Pseudoduganella buxea]
MLTVLAYSMVVVFMFLIMTKRLPALVALIVVPIAFGLLGGFGAALGPMMLTGIKNLAPTGVMLMFAILYFGIMIDAGLFDPAVRLILRLVQGDPMKIVVGTAALAMFISLDGDGATTYMITVSAMLPLYKRLGMSRLVLACVIMLAGGVFNILPWGGPTARAASALGVDVSDIFVPMILPMAVTALWVLFVAYMLGMKERKRVGVVTLDAQAQAKPQPTQAGELQPAFADLALPGRMNGTTGVHGAYAAGMARENNVLPMPGSRHDGSATITTVGATIDADTGASISGSPPGVARPKLIWVNFLLTAALMVSLIMGALPLPALFMIFFALAIMINYPKMQDQKERIAAHAANVLPVVSLIFAAGIFVGILQGTKMVDAIATSVITAIPTWMGPYLAIVTGILSIPFTFFISNDAFYFGIVPVLAKAAAVYGISAAEIGRASIIGQPVHLLSPLVASTYLLVGLSEVEFGDHQRYTLLWSVTAALVMLVAAVLFGVIPLIGQV